METFEQCDNANSSCCTSDCLFEPVGTLCNTSTDICHIPSFCDGIDDICPAPGLAQNCNCTFPFYGPNCTYARCDLFTDCNSCRANASICGWCCSTQTCLQTNLPGVSCPNNNIQTLPCLCSSVCQNGGTCKCGACACQAPYLGVDCGEIIDCTGAAVPANGTIKVPDVCNICGGNGTSCLGCDGKPFGLQKDRCGICGGDGTTCAFQICNYGACASCATAETCAWCQSSGTCVSSTASPTNPCPAGGLITDHNNCPSGNLLIPVPAIVGISAGILSAIIIVPIIVLVALAVAGKKGYDYYVSRALNMEAASTNPTYSDNGLTGTNPLHEN